MEVAPLRLGAARIEITPEHPVPLAGFAKRKGAVFTGVARPLFLRAFYFEQTGAAGEIRRALLVSADLLWWGSERVQPLRQRLRDRFQIPEEAILLCATHTHSGPQTSTLTPAIGQVDPAYLARLEERLMAGVEQACQALEPVAIERGRGQCGLGLNRRGIIGGQRAIAPNPEGLTDREVTVVRFVKSGSAETKAVLAHFTGHPVVASENRISSEYCGVAMARVEEILGHGAVAGFLQGCCGDINVEHVAGDRFITTGDADVVRFAGLLTESIQAVLANRFETLRPALLRAERAVVELPYAEVPSVEALEEQVRRGEGRIEWAGLLLRERHRLSRESRLELTRLDLAEGLRCVGMNAEMVVEYGLYLKRLSQGNCLPVAYANGMIGYVPTEQQLSEGGYEAGDSIFAFGLPAPFDRSLEDRIKGALRRLVRD